MTSVRCTCVLLAASLMLTACASPPMFAEAPGASDGIDLPASAPGLWAKEGKDTGDRARIVRTGPDAFRLEIFNLQPNASEPPSPPFNGRSVHLAGRDWLVLDVASWDQARKERDEMNGYLLLHYQFETPGRVCLQVPTAGAFLAAVESGELAGKVKPEGRFQAVLVTTPAAQWTRWWRRHAAAVELSADRFCLQRLADAPASSGAVN